MKKSEVASAAKKAEPKKNKPALKSEGVRRQRAVETPRISEENFERIVAAIQDVVFSVDADSREFSYLSPAFERLLGYTSEDIKQMGGRQAFLAKVIEAGKSAKPENIFEQIL